jgi:hypothetical protein
MKKISGLNTLYHLGYAVVQFRAILIRPGAKYEDLAQTSAMIWAQLQEMLRETPVPFESSRKVIEEFIAALDNFKDQLPQTVGKLVAGTMDAYRFTDLIGRLETLTAQELDAMPIWFVTKRRAYSIDALIEKAETVLDPDTIPLLSARTTYDLRQAGRALAFEVPTGAGFHAVRATEAVARGYHEIVVGTKPDEGLPLGPLINGLRIKRDALTASLAIDREDLLHIIIEMLNRLNNVYRKPITHPDMVLDLPSALNVFDSAKSAIELMLEDAQKKYSPRPIPPGFF